MLHAVSVVPLLDAGRKGAHLGVGILCLDPLVHFCKLIDAWSLAILQVALVSSDDVPLIFKNRWEVRHVTLGLFVGI